MSKPVVIMEQLPGFVCPRCKHGNLVEVEWVPEEELDKERVRRIEAAAKERGLDSEEHKVVGCHRVAANQTCEHCDLELIIRPPYIGFEP